MYDLTIIKQNGGAYIDSREVAEAIGKRHDNLLRDIAGYIETLKKSDALNFEGTYFFIKSSYVDAYSREKPCYLISKMGCELVANKLTGEKGVLFTAAYVAKFNMMEKAEMERLEDERAHLESELELLSMMPTPRLGEFNACARIIVRALRNMGASSEQIVKFLKGVYEPLGIIVADDNDIANTPQLYTSKQIAKKLGVYSMNGNPHYQAISCILNENLFIGEHHKTIDTLDYGSHTCISIRYDDYALHSVRDWLMEHGYPREVYGF